MPELPEVEVTRLSLLPHLIGKTIDKTEIFTPKLRYPVTKHLAKKITGARINDIQRRGKYILIKTTQGTLMVHLGMTGTLVLKKQSQPLIKHDHANITLGNIALRFNDPRRFGALLWADQHQEDAYFTPFLANLGVEPLDEDFNGDFLWSALKNRSQAIKPLLLAGHVVVGVGNIYASESLFLAGIHPQRLAKRISRKRAHLLADSIRHTLQHAIQLGGSTLRDFQHGNNEAGYFQIHHQVYNREGQPCNQCQRPIRRIVQGQRSTFYCGTCQR